MNIKVVKNNESAIADQENSNIILTEEKWYEKIKEVVDDDKTVILKAYFHNDLVYNSNENKLFQQIKDKIVKLIIYEMRGVEDGKCEPCSKVLIIVYNKDKEDDGYKYLINEISEKILSSHISDIKGLDADGIDSKKKNEQILNKIRKQVKMRIILSCEILGEEEQKRNSLLFFNEASSTLFYKREVENKKVEHRMLVLSNTMLPALLRLGFESYSKTINEFRKEIDEMKSWLTGHLPESRIGWEEFKELFYNDNNRKYQIICLEGDCLFGRSDMNNNDGIVDGLCRASVDRVEMFLLHPEEEKSMIFWAEEFGISLEEIKEHHKRTVDTLNSLRKFYAEQKGEKSDVVKQYYYKTIIRARVVFIDDGKDNNMYLSPYDFREVSTGDDLSKSLYNTVKLPIYKIPKEDFYYQKYQNFIKESKK